mmetsp:Transcript_1738/g.3790  ORF Transcript_1738/g.3790 Transcript_1738/m.3790 type:complete len:96 (+) Transcript_1738:2179-2466(+)
MLHHWVNMAMLTAPRYMNMSTLNLTRSCLIDLDVKYMKVHMQHLEREEDDVAESTCRPAGLHFRSIEVHSDAAMVPTKAFPKNLPTSLTNNLITG